MNPYEYRRESDFQRFVRNRKRVPVNTFLILANLLVFFAVELTGSALSTNPYEYRRESDFQRFVRNRKRVPVNTFLILANLLVFFAVELTGSALSTSHMYRWGAAYAPAIVQGREYYRLVTSMFLHFGIQHLGNNMLVLFFLGMGCCICPCNCTGKRILSPGYIHVPAFWHSASWE